MEDEAGAHGVADQRDWPVAMRSLHQHVRQQPPSLYSVHNMKNVRGIKISYIAYIHVSVELKLN